MSSPLSRLSSLRTGPSGVAIAYLNSLNKAAALRCLLPNQRGIRGAAINAEGGRATSVGALSVPRTWMAAATPIAVYRGTVA